MQHWMTKARLIAILLLALQMPVPVYAQDPEVVPEASILPAPEPAETVQQVSEFKKKKADPVDLKAAQYHVPNLQNLTDFLFANGYIDPNNPQELADYVRIKDCTLFDRYYKDDFTWNKIKSRIINEATALQKNVITHYVVSDIYNIDRYNFDTKSFDIVEKKRLRNVNSLNILDDSEKDPCASLGYTYFGNQTVPINFELRLQAPLSLYRIPMSEAMARYVLPELSYTTVGGVPGRRVYTLIYFTIDGVMAIAGRTALLSGKVDKIEFFLDEQRTQRIKRLVYNLN